MVAVTKGYLCRWWWYKVKQKGPGCGVQLVAGSLLQDGVLGSWHWGNKESWMGVGTYSGWQIMGGVGPGGRWVVAQ
jgi:hypothetical protein